VISVVCYVEFAHCPKAISGHGDGTLIIAAHDFVIAITLALVTPVTPDSRLVMASVRPPTIRR